jgi:hypothetical protein
MDDIVQIVFLHELHRENIDVGDFLSWAQFSKTPLVQVPMGTGYYLSAIRQYKVYVEKRIPHKFTGLLPAIKFFREMVEDDRGGLAEAKFFVEAVMRTPKPANFVE